MCHIVYALQSRPGHTTARRGKPGTATPSLTDEDDDSSSDDDRPNFPQVSEGHNIGTASSGYFSMRFGRRMKWWLVVAEGWMFFYKHYGDSKPKFISALSTIVACNKV